MAALHRAGGGAKFVTLLERTGCGREALRQTLDFLARGRWVRRNLGYGHPMRPEYVLTVRGRGAGPACARVWALLRALEIADVGLRRWSLPVILELRRAPARFSELKARLPGVTSRALALALRALEAAGLVERRLVDARPPAATYALRRLARALLPPLADL